MAIGDVARSHTVITGLLLMAIGLAFAYGSLSGQLAPMVAALLDPEALANSATSSTITPKTFPATSPIFGQLGTGGQGAY
jgi:hypothetical protein